MNRVLISFHLPAAHILHISPKSVPIPDLSVCTIGHIGPPDPGWNRSRPNRLLRPAQPFDNQGGLAVPGWSSDQGQAAGKTDGLPELSRQMLEQARARGQVGAQQRKGEFGGKNWDGHPASGNRAVETRFSRLAESYHDCSITEYKITTVTARS